MTDTDTPSDKLAASTLTRLVEAGLVRSDQQARLAIKIGAGRMTVDDWRLELELAIAKTTSK